jgi:WD40 repeat protein
MIWSEDSCHHILPHLTPSGQPAPVLLFSISTQGKIASFAGDDMLRLWESGELSCSWPMQGITDLIWSPDGSKLMAVSQDSLKFWQGTWEVQSDLSEIMSAQWKNDFEFSVVTAKAVWLCKFSESKLILEDSCSNARWNKQSSVLGMICNNRLGLFTESSEVWWISVRVTQFDFAPVEGIIVTGGFAGEIQFWDIERRVIRNSFQGHSGKILRIVFRDDGEFVATTATDGVLHIWKTQEFNKVKSFAIEPVGDL